MGVIGFNVRIDLQSLRLYGLPETAPAVLNGTPLLTGALFGAGRREFAAEVSWDLPSLAPGATALIDVTVIRPIDQSRCNEMHNRHFGMLVLPLDPSLGNQQARGDQRHGGNSRPLIDGVDRSLFAPPADGWRSGRD